MVRYIVASVVGVLLGVSVLCYASWRDQTEREARCRLVSKTVLEKDRMLETWYCGSEER